MAKSPQYMEDLGKGFESALIRGDGVRADEFQQKSIEHLTQHVRVLWNHIERLEKLLAVGNRTPAAPAPQSVKLNTAFDIDIRAEHDMTIESGNHTDIRVGNSLAIAAGIDFRVVSARRVEIRSGDRNVVISDDEMHLQCGAAQFSMKKDGSIALKGKDITLDGSGKVNVKGGSAVTLKGPNIKQN